MTYRDLIQQDPREAYPHDYHSIELIQHWARPEPEGVYRPEPVSDQEQDRNRGDR